MASFSLLIKGNFKKNLLVRETTLAFVVFLLVEFFPLILGIGDKPFLEDFSVFSIIRSVRSNYATEAKSGPSCWSHV